MVWHNVIPLGVSRDDWYSLDLDGTDIRRRLVSFRLKVNMQWKMPSISLIIEQPCLQCISVTAQKYIIWKKNRYWSSALHHFINLYECYNKNFAERKEMFAPILLSISWQFISSHSFCEVMETATTHQFWHMIRKLNDPAFSLYAINQIQLFFLFPMIRGSVFNISKVIYWIHIKYLQQKIIHWLMGNLNGIVD